MSERATQSAESAEGAFDALMARRNGEPLPEATCTHFSRDHEGKCWACVSDERERAMKADAWDECARQAHDLCWLADSELSDLLARNPYRRNPPVSQISGGAA